MNEKKERKKKKALLLLALLLALVVLTGTVIGTLAKYITSSVASDSARAAKFGLNTPAIIDLFSDSYNNVKADSSGTKIVAPGTSGQYNFRVEGNSEVAYRVGAEVLVTYSDDWNGYEPLKFSVDNENWTNLEDFRQNLSAALESEVLQPNTPYAGAQTIYWQWPYSVSSEKDLLDTAIGTAAASGTVHGVTVTITVTATQVD